jgi:hypothetical protein
LDGIDRAVFDLAADPGVKLRIAGGQDLQGGKDRVGGLSTVMTGTALGARKDDHRSSGNSLMLAGTVMPGIVDIADSVGPAPFDRPI